MSTESDASGICSGTFDAQVTSFYAADAQKKLARDRISLTDPLADTEVSCQQILRDKHNNSRQTPIDASHIQTCDHFGNDEEEHGGSYDRVEEATSTVNLGEDDGCQ